MAELEDKRPTWSGNSSRPRPAPLRKGTDAADVSNAYPRSGGAVMITASAEIDLTARAGEPAWEYSRRARAALADATLCGNRFVRARVNRASLPYAALVQLDPAVHVEVVADRVDTAQAFVALISSKTERTAAA